MPNIAVFLDRDGTINEDPGYLGDPDKVKLYAGAAEALQRLKKANILLVVISNQSGIARGLISRENVEAVNGRINEILRDKEAEIDAFFYCPYHPDFSSEEECGCRKPSPSLVFKAADQLDIDLTRSYFVGDSVSDIECGMNARIKTVLVRSGYGNESFSILQKQNKLPNFTAENITDACNYILNDLTERK